MSPPAAAPSRGRLLPPRAAPPQSSSPQQSAGKFPQGPPPPRFVLPSGRGFPAQAPVRAAVSAASRVLHAGDRTGAASPPISTGVVIRPSDPTRPAAAPAHRVGLAPPRPGHSPFSRDAQATAARGEYTATIGDAQAMAPIDDDTTDVNMQTDWSLGDEEEFQRQNNLGVPVADSFNSQG
ncbi:hypothetical protein E2562_026164 [Oryza meyeriana var. granulata]|uniref:Uncharacterized protein n=1 Tax=Oryza meyeriana var. granulata TaxID=110450 RepID=A0A6G1E1W2_9ORYZ|nr:hypothetical protein E2562_026164 [Oryza meyeriana var. granulata]